MITNKTNDKELIEARFDFYYKEKIKVHIELISQKFYNGIILSKKDDGIYLIKDDIEGERFIFLSEVYKIDQYINKEKRQ
jgi:hypothetical protein